MRRRYTYRVVNDRISVFLGCWTLVAKGGTLRDRHFPHAYVFLLPHRTWRRLLHRSRLMWCCELLLLLGFFPVSLQTLLSLGGPFNRFAHALLHFLLSLVMESDLQTL